MQEILLKTRYFERGLSKAIKTQKGPGNSDQSLNKFELFQYLDLQIYASQFMTS